MSAPLHTQLFGVSDDHLDLVEEGLIRLIDINYRCVHYDFVEISILDSKVSFYNNNLKVLVKDLSFNLIDPPRSRPLETTTETEQE